MNKQKPAKPQPKPELRAAAKERLASALKANLQRRKLAAPKNKSA